MEASNHAKILDLAANVGQLLKAKRLLAVTAESCTGGGVSQALTEIAGSSAWFDCGFVTYSNASKNELLDISEALIAQHGTVSEEIAAAMAEGALANSSADVAVSGKPVGTVCFGWVVNNTTHTERLIFNGDRQAVREQTVLHALQGLQRYLTA
jgi:nicotinamide-nucleotide amidase